MSAGEPSVTVSLYLVIRLPQLWLMEPFQAACKKTTQGKGAKMRYQLLVLTYEGWERKRKNFLFFFLNHNLGIRCRGVVLFPLISASHQALLL